MTQLVTVQTDFVDLNQMTQGLMERVHETHVILTGPEDIAEGEWVQFAVNLQDGSAGFAGMGRCVRSVDNGDSRLPHQRYDLVLDSLQFDQQGQDVYQYILMSRQSLEAPEDDEDYENAGEFADSADDDAFADASADDRYEDDNAYDDEGDYDDDGGEAEYGEEATRVETSRKLGAMLADTGAEAAEDRPLESYAETDDAEEYQARSAEVPVAEDYHVPGAMDAGEFGAAPEPEPPSPPADRRFVYAQGLPIPGIPPRPNLDPSLRVTPAPRPFTPSTAPRVPDDGYDPFENRRAAGHSATNGSAEPIDISPDEAELEPVSIEPEPMEDKSSRSV